MRRAPKYLLHRASVQIDGKDHYLGPYGSDESKQRYDELIARWLCAGRKPDSVNVTMNRLSVLYIEHAQCYYRKNGKTTSEVSSIRCAFNVLLSHFGRLPVNDFAPLKLKTIRNTMIAAGWVRNGINQQVRRITRMLRWGVEQELVGTARSSPAFSAGSRSPLEVPDLCDVSPRTRRTLFLRAERVVGFGCCQTQDCTAKWLRREGAVGGRPESPSTEDACLRCWLNSDSPDGDGGARHWGCCHRTLVRARARDETPRRTADSFGV